MTEEVEDFLAHYGVKGMKWGVRKDKIRAKRKSDHRSLSKGQKTLAVAGGVALGLAGANVISAATMNVPLGIAMGSAIGVAGKRHLTKVMADGGKTKVKDIK